MEVHITVRCGRVDQPRSARAPREVDVSVLLLVPPLDPVVPLLVVVSVLLAPVVPPLEPAVLPVLLPVPLAPIEDVPPVLLLPVPLAPVLLEDDGDVALPDDGVALVEPAPGLVLGLLGVVVELELVPPAPPDEPEPPLCARATPPMARAAAAARVVRVFLVVDMRLLLG
jgi:hypothetical protein